MRTSIFRLLAVTVGAALAPAAVQAEYLSAYSGNAVVVVPSAADGVINFSVYDNKNNDFGQTVASFVSAPNATARYIYAFQVVNSRPSLAGGTNSNITALDIQVANTADVVGFGQVLASTFTENGTAINATTNTRLDGNPADPNPPPSTNSSTIGLPGVTVGAAGASGTKSSSDAYFSMTDNGGMVAEFTFRDLAGGAYSNILLFYSNQGPTAVLGGLLASGSGGFGISSVPGPSPTPEPGTMVLLGLGLPLVGIGYRRLRKGTAEAPATV